MITQARLKELLHYDPETGVFIRKAKQSNQMEGAIAGGEDGSGYLRIRIDGKKYKSHRLAWLYMFGILPANKTDHINQNRSDNRICNLREVTDGDNSKNASRRSDNRSGITGVYWSGVNQKWAVQINDNGEQKFLGRYESLLDAAAVRIKANSRYNYHENHGS